MIGQTKGLHCRPARYVGRVGALAVALGVGTAVLGFSSVAAADGETGGPGRSAGEGSTRAEDAGRATATRSGDRRNTHAPATSSDDEGSGTRTAGPGQRAVNPRASLDSRDSQPPQVAQPSAGGLQSDPVDSASRVLPSLPNPPADAALPGAGQVSQTALPLPIAALTVTPEPATTTATAAAAPAAALTADGSPASGADGGGEPLLAPLAWATLAAARRDDLAGATPEVLPAATEGTVDLEVGSSVGSIKPTTGAVGDPITISGSALGGTTTVKFGCTVGTSECGWGVVAVPSESPTTTQVKVTVPVGAPSGYIELSGINTATGVPWSAKSSQSFTVVGAAPTIDGFTPQTGNIGTGGPTVTITGQNFTGAVFVQFGSGKQTSLNISEDGKAITVAIPDGATTGPIVVGLATGGTVSTGQFTVPLKTPLPPLSNCSGALNCTAVSGARLTGINALSTIFGQAFPSSGPVGTCAADSTGTNGCPIPYGQTGPSVANTFGIYAFNILYSLSGANTSVADIGNAVTALATQPDVLNFISQSVAGSAALAALPPAVSTTIGAAVETFVQTSLGNATVANGLVPFLRALNLPTDIGATLEFAKLLAKDPIAAVLSRFNSTQWPKAQTALQQSFFGNGPVEAQLGTAFTAAINVLLSSPAVSGYLGQVAASALVGTPVGPSNPLAVTLGGAIANFLATPVGVVPGVTVGSTIAADAGTALATLLATPVLGGEPAVATTLADAVVNRIVGFLGVGILPYPVQLLPALSPGAGVAVTGFVNSLLTTPGIDAALGALVTEVTTGVLSDQQVVSQVVSQAVTGALGGGALAQAVGANVGAAAAVLAANPAVSGAVAALVNSVFGSVLGAPGVVTALADTAGGLTTAVLDGESLGDALNAAVAAFGSNPDVQAAVGPAVTTGVEQFLSDTALRSAVDTAFASLVTGLVGDPTVQQALSGEVASAVSGLLGGGDLGTTVGAQVGAAVVALLADPAVSGALVALVDTVFGDFISAQGVIPALSDAAGELATAALAGTLPTVQPQVLAALKANPDIDAAIQGSVVAAVAQFLGDTALWSTVDLGLSALVNEVLADTVVQDALSTRVANEVNSFLGFGPISVVGEDVGAAVVALITNPVVTGALGDLVDTLFSDFFGSPGVIDAVAGAAGDVALAVFTGESLDAALTAAGKALRVNPAVDTGVQNSVGAAVTQFLGDTALWSTVDAGITALATQLITDPVVQQALNDRVAEEVSAALGGGDLGEVVGAQVAATVLGLLTNPTVGTALLEVVDTLFSDLFGTPGVDEALGQAAGDLALAALTLTGADYTAAVQGIVAGLRNNPALDTGVQNSVEAAVAQLLNDTAAWAIVDGAISTLVGELIGDTAVQQALATRVANEVNSFLGLGPISVVGDQVGAFVVGLLTNPVVAAALPDVVDSVLTDFFGAAGVADAIAGAAGDIALAVFTGESAAAAFQDALNALRNNPAIQAGVEGTVADALNVVDTEILSNTTFQQDLGQDITDLINELAADPPVQALVTERFGPAIGGLFANTAVVGDIATAVGTAVTGLLGYPGVSTAVTDALAVFIDAVLGGTSTGQAATEALQALQSDPAFVAAANSVIPPIVNGLLDTAEVREAIGVAVQEATLARLEGTWPDIPFVDRLVAQVAKGTVEDFLTRPAGQRLIDDVVVDVVLGTTGGDVTDVLVRELLRRPAAQIALGFSIGAGIGSLFGDNIFADVIGFVAGFPATLVVGVAAVAIGIYQWIVGGLLSVTNALAAAAESAATPYPWVRTA